MVHGPCVSVKHCCPPVFVKHSSARASAKRTMLSGWAFGVLNIVAIVGGLVIGLPVFAHKNRLGDVFFVHLQLARDVPYLLLRGYDKRMTTEYGIPAARPSVVINHSGARRCSPSIGRSKSIGSRRCPMPRTSALFALWVGLALEEGSSSYTLPITIRT